MKEKKSFSVLNFVSVLWKCDPISHLLFTVYGAPQHLHTSSPHGFHRKTGNDDDDDVPSLCFCVFSTSTPKDLLSDFEQFRLYVLELKSIPFKFINL